MQESVRELNQDPVHKTRGERENGVGSSSPRKSIFYLLFLSKKEPSTGIPEINLTNPRDADLTTF